MRLVTSALAGAAAIVAAVQYVFCAALVALVPESFTRLVGYVIHADLSSFDRSISWFGFCVGLVAWTVLCAASAAALGVVYNRSVK